MSTEAYERGFIDGMQKQMQSSVDKAVNAMSRQAKKHEPVAWITRESKWRLTGGGNAGGTVPVHAKQSNTAKYPLYAIPQPQREWVGLTDAELAEFSDMKLGSYDLCLEVEAKLRSKNT